MILAIDFDGTIVEHKYPKIGKEIPLAIDKLRQLQEDGFQLILWTSRYGELLDEAVAYCQDRGLEFYAINKNFPEETDNHEAGRKIVADCYIDDRNLGGLPNWTEIYRLVTGKEEIVTPVRRASVFSWRRS
ncbi:BT0820 family HAD-type phosphatase [Mangrovibacterium diazotrophicum]|uniref:Hydrolase n=1 Tax=Mangrovibacterium diazotrophicum TaxID=1261403 RepID=A0A419W956_9BACT|nr:hypothetical protein [Mangrovibacterium diazotrophicum]RKD91993.1 hypothetical protein BC643_2362 [Mangrovibacterium diazotrophicum]